MDKISNKLDKIPFFARIKKNERIEGKIGFYFDIIPFEQQLKNEEDPKSRLYYQQKTIKGGFDIGLSGKVKQTIWGLPIDKIPVVGEKLKEYINAVSAEDYEKFLGERSKSLEERLEDNKEVFIRLKDR